MLRRDPENSTETTDRLFSRLLLDPTPDLIQTRNNHVLQPINQIVRDGMLPQSRPFPFYATSP